MKKAKWVRKKVAVRGNHRTLYWKLISLWYSGKKKTNWELVNEWMLKIEYPNRISHSQLQTLTMQKAFCIFIFLFALDFILLFFSSVKLNFKWTRLSDWYEYTGWYTVSISKSRFCVCFFFLLLFFFPFLYLWSVRKICHHNEILGFFFCHSIDSLKS